MASIEQPQPFSYRELSDLYNELGGNESFGTLSDFSSRLNRGSGTELFNQGVQDNWIKQASTGLDRLIEATPLDEAGRAFGGAVGRPFGMEELGRDLGGHLPRDLATVGVTAAGSAIPFVGPVVGPVMGGSLAAADAYTQGASPLGSVVQGGAMALTGPIARAGGQIGLKIFGAPLAEGVVSSNVSSKLGQAVAKAVGLGEAGSYFSSRIARTVPERLARYGGEQLALLGAQEGATALQQTIDKATGYSEEGYNPLTKEHVFETLFGQLAFAPVDALDIVSKKPSEAAVARYLTTEESGQAGVKHDTDLEAGGGMVDTTNVPATQTTENLRKSQSIISEAVLKMQTIKTDPSIPEADKGKLVNEIMRKMNEDVKGLRPVPVAKAAAAATTPATPGQPATPVATARTVGEQADLKVQQLHETAKGVLVKVVGGDDTMKDKNFWVPKSHLDSVRGQLGQADPTGVQDLKILKTSLKEDARPERAWRASMKPDTKAVDEQLSMLDSQNQPTTTRMGQPVNTTPTQTDLGQAEDIATAVSTASSAASLTPEASASVATALGSALATNKIATVDDIPLGVRNLFPPQAMKYLSIALKTDPQAVVNEFTKAATGADSTSPSAWDNLPQWQVDLLKSLADAAEASGLANKIEELSANRMTAKQIAQELGIDENTVQAVRINRRIPSWTNALNIGPVSGGAAVESPEFTKWLADRQARKTNTVNNIAKLALDGLEGTDKPTVESKVEAVELADAIGGTTSTDPAMRAEVVKETEKGADLQKATTKVVNRRVAVGDRSAGLKAGNEARKTKAEQKALDNNAWLEQVLKLPSNTPEGQLVQRFVRLLNMATEAQQGQNKNGSITRDLVSAFRNKWDKGELDLERLEALFKMVHKRFAAGKPKTTLSVKANGLLSNDPSKNNLRFDTFEEAQAWVNANRMKVQMDTKLAFDQSRYDPSALRITHEKDTGKYRLTFGYTEATTSADNRALERVLESLGEDVADSSPEHLEAKLQEQEEHLMQVALASVTGPDTTAVSTDKGQGTAATPVSFARIVESVRAMSDVDLVKYFDDKDLQYFREKLDLVTDLRAKGKGDEDITDALHEYYDVDTAEGREEAKTFVDDSSNLLTEAARWSAKTVDNDIQMALADEGPAGWTSTGVSDVYHAIQTRLQVKPDDNTFDVVSRLLTGKDVVAPEDRWAMDLLDYLSTVHAVELGGVKYADRLPGMSDGIAFYDSGNNQIYVGHGRAHDVDEATALASIAKTIAHEVVHALTVNNLRHASPDKQREMLGLRTRALRALPETTKKVIQRAIDSKAYERYITRNREQDVAEGFDWAMSREEQLKIQKELAKYGVTPEDITGVMYSFVDAAPYEFTSQALSHRGLQNFLRSVPDMGKQSAWKNFTGFVKRLLGVNSNIESLFDRVLDEVKNISSNYEGPKFYTRRLLLNDHFSNEGYTKHDTARLMALSEGLGKTASRQDVLMNLLNPALELEHNKQESVIVSEWLKTEPGQAWSAELNKLVPGQPSTEMFRLVELQESKPDVYRDLLEAASPSIVRYITKMDELADSVQQSWVVMENNAKAGLVNRAMGDSDEVPVTAPDPNSSSVTDQIYRNAEALANTTSASLEGYGSMMEASGGIVNAPPPTPKIEGANVRETLLDGLNLAGKGLSNFERWITPFVQLSQKYPVLKPIANAALRYQADVRRLRATVFDPMSHWYIGGTPSRSADVLKRNEATMANPKLMAVVDDILRYKQREEKPFDWTKDANKVQGFDSLNKNDKEAVMNLTYVVENQTKLVQKLSMNTQTLKGVNNAAKLISLRTDYGADRSKQLAQELYDAVGAGDTNALAKIQAEMGQDEGFLNALQFVTDDTVRLRQLEDFYNRRSWFASAQRFERFIIQYEQNGKSSTSPGFDTQREVDHYIRMKSKDPTFKVSKIDDKQSNQSNQGINGQVIDKLREVEQARRDQLQQMIAQVNPQLANEVGQVPLGVDDLLTDMAARATVLPGSRRKLKGLDELPLFQNHQKYLMVAAGTMAKDLMRSETALRFVDPELRNNPEMWQTAKTHVDNFTHPDTPLGTFLSKSAFNYYLAFRMSTVMLEMAQAPLTHAAQLTSEGAGITGSYKLLWSAMKEITKWATTKKWSNPEHGALMSRALAEGQIALGPYDFWGVDQDAVREWKIRANSQGKKGFGTPAEMLRSSVFHLEKWASNLYGIATHFNARLAMIASFDFYRKQGKSFDEAYDLSRMFNASVNMSSGRVGRPVGMFAGRTAVGRTASQALYSLQSYNLGAMAMMFRLAHDAFMGNTSVSIQQRKAARKAFFQMGATQFAYAGTLGLPAVGAIIGLMEQMFPDLEIRKTIQEALASTAGEDEELGEVIADVGMNGLASAVLPVDVGSRMSLGNSILGTSSYNGFDANNLFGPSVSMFRDIFTGTTDIASGNPQGLEQLMPLALRDVIKAWNSDFKFRDASGALLKDATPGEKFGMIIGFQPSEVRRMKDQDRIRRRTQDIDRRELQKFNARVAAMVEAGDFESAKMEMAKREQTDPFYDAAAGARFIAKEVEKRQLPKDPRRFGTRASAGSQSELNRLFATNAQGSELQRMQYRARIEQLLGAPGPGPRSFQHAAQLDMFMDENPYLSRSAAEHAMRNPDVMASLESVF